MFRHYAGMMRDEKLVRAAVKSRQPVERVVWVWGAILESAAEANDSGRFDFDADEAAYFLRCEPSDLSTIVQALCDLGRIDAGRVTKWGERQFDSDAAKERQKRYRERQKASRNAESYVTSPSRDGAVTAQETESETEAETERKQPAPDNGAGQARAEFSDLLEAFPQNPSASESKALAAWERLKPRDRPAVVQAAIRYAKWFGQDCEARDRTVDAGLHFVPHLSNWLDSGQWREAEKLAVKGEPDPDLAVVLPDTPEFDALQRHRGKPIKVYGKSVTVKRTELAAAMQAVH